MLLEHFATPGGKSVWLHIRPDTNDHNTAFSCLNEDEYALPRISGVAWDIGAYTGAVSIALALDNPDLHVIAVEPVPDNILLLARNLDANHVRDRVTIVAGAVGRGEVVVRYGFTGSEVATHHANVGNASILDRDAATEQVTYRGLELGRMLDDYGVPAIVKIDTEGAEWTFLDDLYNTLLPLIVGEWHPGYGSREDFAALLPHHTVTFTGPEAGPGGFRAAW